MPDYIEVRFKSQCYLPATKGVDHWTIFACGGIEILSCFRLQLNSAPTLASLISIEPAVAICNVDA